jgi:hypothetical protein
MMNTRLPFLAATLALCPMASALDLIPFGSTWDYMHPTNNVDPADADADFDTTWFLGAADFAASYNGPPFGANPAVNGPPVDSGSGAAPIGYGVIGTIDANLGGFVTMLSTPTSGERGSAYFRHNFTVAVDVDNIAIEIIADDGAVIYLDGVELTRKNFAGPDTFAAPSSTFGIETDTSLLRGRLGGLAAGSHTLAMSVHQLSTTSSDLGFDLRLSDEGFVDPPLGLTAFDGGGASTPFFATGDLGSWVSDDAFSIAVNNGGGAEVRSEVIDLSAIGEVIFTMSLGGREGSGASNFEDDDTLSARLEIETAGGATSTILLVTGGWDLDGNGALNGEEFGAGAAPNAALDFTLNPAVRIPADAVEATLVIDGVNNSDSEAFFAGDAVFALAPVTPIVLGTAEFGAPTDIALLVGPGGWTVAAEKTFALNGTSFVERLVSDPIDVSGAPSASVSLLLTASETSLGSNFEATDQFQARAEVTDANGLGRVIFLQTPADADGNGILSGDEIAVGVDIAEQVSEAIPFTADLPNGTVSVQLVILAVNNSSSETFTLSEVKVGSQAPDFAILSVTSAGGEVDVVWESEAGATYELQFSPDLSGGSFTTVETVVATGLTATTSHVPGTTAGFYRVRRQP